EYILGVLEPDPLVQPVIAAVEESGRQHLRGGKARRMLKVSGATRAAYGECNAKCSDSRSRKQRCSPSHLRPSQQPYESPLIAPKPCLAVSPHVLAQKPCGLTTSRLARY